MLHVGVTEAYLLQLSAAVGPSEVEAFLRLDQYVQAHEHDERLLPAIMIDERLVVNDHPTLG